MCGICCILHFCGTTHHIEKCINQVSRLHQRGPDRSDVRHVRLKETANVMFYGHVLHLRGDDTVSQPAEDSEGNILLWNGEIFSGIKVGDHESDTQVLLNCLSKNQSDDHVLSVMSQIQGPWAFIYWQSNSEALWFGRDVFGRRSLLWHLPESDTDQFVLSSVLVKPFSFTEIPSVGIYKMVLKKPSEADTKLRACEISLFPWKHAVWPGSLDPVCKETFHDKITEGVKPSVPAFHLCEDKQVPSQMPHLNKDIPDTDSVLPPLEDNMSSLEYLQMLLSTNKYLQTLSRQLSHVLLEAVKTRVFNQQRKKPQRVGEDGDMDTIDPASCEQTDLLARGSIINGCVDGTPKNSRLFEHIDGAIKDSADSETTDLLTRDANPNRCTDASTSAHLGHEQTGCVANDGDVSGKMAACSLSPDPVVSSAHVAILFSGGIDSTVLATLADRCVPKDEPIDLINVAFEQREKKTGTGKKKRHEDQATSRGWDVPDRLTGYVALSELNPERDWNFIEVNVTAAELQDARHTHISELLYPLDTVLDDSIGCAVWFAARGQGILGNGVRKGQQIHSRAKVILCGMGADEQLAGYSRHRVRFKTEGWAGLVKEIELELTRISARNLGRDDRIITDHGKESRFPFLDERVVHFLCSLHIQEKADLSLPRGLGEKLLLRLCAVELGLDQTATLPKRAIQFGSRIAKMENSKENASDKCERLTKAKS